MSRCPKEFAPSYYIFVDGVHTELGQLSRDATFWSSEAEFDFDNVLLVLASDILGVLTVLVAD